ncbi:hypothetical protein GF325_09860 [Candidatus Bathyarchaeota archaeon]|nr:hypothetical protein [Candidatus Bathyarchaeota archaeon]
MVKISVVTYSCGACGKRQQLYDAKEAIKCKTCKSNICLSCIRKGGVCPQCEPFVTEDEKEELESLIGMVVKARKGNYFIVTMFCIGILIGLLCIPFFSMGDTLAGIGLVIVGIAMTGIGGALLKMKSKKDKQFSAELEEAANRIAGKMQERKISS